jgi:hypothetical protein
MRLMKEDFFLIYNFILMSFSISWLAHAITLVKDFKSFIFLRVKSPYPSEFKRSPKITIQDFLYFLVNL